VYSSNIPEYYLISYSVKFEMFAYVKFVGFGANSSCMKIVSIENIKMKGSDVKNINQNKLYKVKHPETGKYSNAQVILVNGNNFNKKIVLYL